MGSLICVFLLMQIFHLALTLNPSGANVCSSIISYTAYTQVTKTRNVNEQYAACCKMVWSTCWSRCTKYRMKIASFQDFVPITQYRRHFSCCSGWTQSGNECSIRKSAIYHR